MRWLASCSLVTLVSLAVVGNAVAGVEVSIAGGRISIVARDATVGEILREWARVGQMKVEHLERVPPERVTIQLENATEQEALAVLLRHAGGYMAARREDAGPNASVFDRVLIVPIVVARTAPAPVAPGAQASAAGGRGTTGGSAAPDQAAAEQAPPQSAEPVVEDMPPPPDDQPMSTPTPLAGEVPLTDAQAQAAIRERRALETADARKFKFPKPQVVLQPVTQPGKPGGQ